VTGLHHGYTAVMMRREDALGSCLRLIRRMRRIVGFLLSKV